MRSHHFKVTNFVFLGCRITQMVIAAVKLKDACSLEEKLWQCMKKQRHHFANKGRCSQSYGFSSSHVWMWELDHKEGWAPKNWCFGTVVLKRRSNQSILKEISPEYSLEGLMLKQKLPYFGHLMWRADSFEKTLALGKIEGNEGGDNRGWDDWMVSLTRWTWVWVSSGSWWRAGKHGMLQSMVLQRVGLSDWTKLMRPDVMIFIFWMLSFKPAFFTLLFHFHQEAL